MKPSILVVMLDFLVCSLLMFVVGKGDERPSMSRSSADANAAASIHEEFAPAAIVSMREEWNREYEQQFLVTQLHAQTVENIQLRSQVRTVSAELDATSGRLTAKEQEAQTLKELTARREAELQKLDADLQQLAANKLRVEQERSALQQHAQQLGMTVVSQEAALRELDQSLKTIADQKARAEQEKQATAQALMSAESQLARVHAERQGLLQESQTLRQQTEQLGLTVASQQATIRTLSDEVRAAQQQLDSRFDDLAGSQRQMIATLGRLDEFTRALPETMRDNLSGLRDNQQTLQGDIAALTDTVRALQGEISGEERQALLNAITTVAQGQKNLQGQMEELIQRGPDEQVARGLSAIQTGQDALRNETARLAEQVETIKARKPGPFQAVKNARIELRVNIAKRDHKDTTIARYRRAIHLPVADMNGRAYLLTTYEGAGLGWWGIQSLHNRDEITELSYAAYRDGADGSSTVLTSAACVLEADPRVLLIPVTPTSPSLTAMKLAGPAALYQTDDRKLHVFKNTAAGLSFEVDTSPLLADTRYLVVKRPVRGMASWFENPAYRPEPGDYVATADGLLVGIMVDREKCFVLDAGDAGSCALSIPMSDKQAFQRATVAYRSLRR